MNGRHVQGAGVGVGVGSPSKSSRSREKAKMTTNGNPSEHCGVGSGAARVPMRPEDVTEEVLEAERSTVLLGKQSQLEKVLDRHDSMVRELFHLDEYMLMLTYDPQAAKLDNSSDFTKYKATYDLIEKVKQQTSSTRRTRGTRSEQLSVASGLPPSPSKTLQQPQARKPKGSKDKLPPAVIHEIISSVQGKAQEREKKAKHDKDSEEVGPGPTDIPSNSKIRLKKSQERAEDGRGILSMIDVDQFTQTTVPSISAPSARRTRARERVSAESLSAADKSSRKPVGIPVQVGSVSTTLGRRSGRRRGDDREEPPTKKPRVAVEEPLNNLQEAMAPKSASQPPKFVVKPFKNKGPEFLMPTSPEIAVTTPSVTIKRVKLIVRPPSPSLSHHKQRPPPPKFNRSLSGFLASYKTFGGEEISDEKIASNALAEARIREREADFRHQGRFIPGTDALFGSDPNVAAYDPPKRTTRDVWDDIVEIISITRSRVPKKTIGQQVAAQIASKVQAYWDTQEVKRDKARAQEEKKLKILAKATIKMVNTEWKKVVHHVREQKRLKLEAEERRRGHEHLDAILDQSGQLLETQQGDLRRARSRSSSMDIGLDEWSEADEEDEEETEEGSVGGSDDEGETGVDGTSELVSEGGTGEVVPSSTREPSEADYGDQAEGETHGTEDGTALLLGPARESVVSSSRPVQSEDGELGVDDVETPADEPSIRHDTSPIGDTDELNRAEPRLLMSVEPPSRLSLGSERRSSRGPAEIILSPACITVGVDEAHVKEKAAEQGGVDDERSARMEEEEEEESAVAARAEEEEEEEEEEEREKMGLEDSQGGGTEVQDQIGSEAEAQVDGGRSGPDEEEEELEEEVDFQPPNYLQPFAVARVEWNAEEKIKPPLLLRGILRPYQQTGLEWLSSLHTNNLNGILADEMGLGKTIQTISLLAHLACDRGIWGPHLIIVPTSVLLNWEMEFKKFLPGFKVLSYHGTTKRRKELRQGWNDKYHFNVCITSYTLASRDAHIFKRKPWYYMILDEAHMIKNFKSQRWNILLMFRSFRRLLLTGTPLQNNLTELWALLQFLMSGSNFANLKEFGDWFANPLEKAIEMGSVLDDETMQRVTKLHTVLRPYLLRRLKRDVEKELPSKFEHLVLCPLSKRQRFLYDEFMSRAQTRNDLHSGVYQKIANILMQLRKVCNHPDLFEVRPIVTSFAMQRSAISDFEIKELLVRKRWLEAEDENVNLGLFGYRFIDQQDKPLLTAVETRRLSASSHLPHINDLPGEPPPHDTRTIARYRRYMAYMQEVDIISRWKHNAYTNDLRCSQAPIYSSEMLSLVKQMDDPLLPFSALDLRHTFMGLVLPAHKAVLSYAERAQTMVDKINKFAFVTPSVVALDLPMLALRGFQDPVVTQPVGFDQILHPASVKLQIAFPDPSLLQYDCGKLQQLKKLLQEKKAGGHRILIFTQMTRILDILEIFLNLHGYLYLRLDGATKIEDRQYITERFNADARIFCFIASSRSGGVGINLTGADTVVFYDSDFNPQMDKQCEDRAHRIGQIRDVHIYRFVSQHTVEEAMLHKANQKRSLDDLVIQRGEFDWRTIFNDGTEEDSNNGAVAALTKALGEFEDVEDAHAAVVAAREEYAMEGADNDDFGAEGGENGGIARSRSHTAAREVDRMESGGEATIEQTDVETGDIEGEQGTEVEEEQEEEGGTVVDYMLTVVQREYGDFFKDWRL